MFKKSKAAGWIEKKMEENKITEHSNGKKEIAQAVEKMNGGWR